MTFKKHIYFLFIALSFTISSCEKEKEGIIDSNFSAPFISSVTIPHNILNLDTTTSSSVTLLPNGTYRITDSLFAQTTSVSGAQTIKSIYYRIYRPGSDNHFSSGILSPSISNLTTTLYSGSFSFIVDRTEAGSYKIEVFAENSSGNTSNFVQVSLMITRNNSTPVILSTVVPDTVYLPPGDSLLIRMTAAIADSDGISDIQEVFFYSLNSSDPTRKFPLLDDGNINSISGDVLQGDGVYTITVKLLDQGNVRRTFEFEFHAVDRQGSNSASVLRMLTVQ